MEKYKEDLLDGMNQNFVEHQQEINEEIEKIVDFETIVNLINKKLHEYHDELTRRKKDNMDARDGYKKRIENGNENSLEHLWCWFNGDLYGSPKRGHLKRLLMVLEEESRRFRNKL